MLHWSEYFLNPKLAAKTADVNRQSFYSDIYMRQNLNMSEYFRVDWYRGLWMSRYRHLVMVIGNAFVAEFYWDKGWGYRILSVSEYLRVDRCRGLWMSRYRHLMMDIMALLPHSKKDVKVQAKDNKADTLNELADLKGCSSCLLFEVPLLLLRVLLCCVEKQFRD